MAVFFATLDRALIALSGPDVRNFLQGLVTNDVQKLAPDRVLYSALLTPQGKVLFDFFLHERGSAVLLDCATEAAPSLEKRLSLYKLRAKVEFARPAELSVVAFWGKESPTSLASPDPRLAGLGWRGVIENARPVGDCQASYTALRLDLGVPEGEDFGHDAIFALDAGLEELHGVSFDKGCYVGQELTARMKHRGTARKRLVPVRTDASTLAKPATSITAAGKEIGTISSTYGNRGFALVRLDRLAELGELQLEAGGIPVFVSRPSWVAS